MFFTIEDYKKIQEWLSRNSIKDTEFNEAMQPFKGNEIISFVQNGHNTKAYLKDFVDQLFLLGIPDFVNITEKFDESNISLSRAIQLIPYKSRKIGQVITFLNEEGVWKIYQFKGKRKNQWNEESLWIDLIKDIASKITTLADEEDITTVEENGATVFKFKDKVYNPDNFSGKGRVYLRKNIVTVKDPKTGNTYKTNLLTQQMLGKESTIYIIQYDYNLNGQTITILEGSVLLFQGGSINNGIINCINTVISENFHGNAELVGNYEYSIYTIDKIYSPNNFSGLGKVYLKKNIIDGNNVITQSMINRENTIYVIQYDYDAQGQVIYVPFGCTLSFEGGNITNGLLVSNRTKLINCPYKFNIIGRIYNSSGEEITYRGDVIHRNTILVAPCRMMNYNQSWSLNEYGKIDTIFNARNVGITDLSIPVALQNDSSGNIFVKTEEVPTGTDFANRLKEHGFYEIFAIKFHTQSGFDNSIAPDILMPKYNSFLIKFVEDVISNGVKVNNVYLCNEESIWTSNSSSYDPKYAEYLRELGNYFIGIGITPRISYQSLYHISSARSTLDNIIPDLNFYPTIGFSDEKTTVTDYIVNYINNKYLNPVKGILLNKYTLDDIGISECGITNYAKAFRYPYQFKTEYLGEKFSKANAIFWNIMIQVFNKRSFKVLDVWFIETMTETNSNITSSLIDSVDEMYNIFRTLK